jgi:antitoxin component YwqK of YwqJK toxin-antitoxin module
MKIHAYLRFLLVPLLALGLTACKGKVDCNDGSVKEDALEIIQSNLDKAVWYNEMKLAITGTSTLENIKTEHAAESGKRAECSATYLMTYNGKERSFNVEYELAYLEDKKETDVAVGIGAIQGGLMNMAASERPVKNGEEKLYGPNNKDLLVLRHWKNGREDGIQEFYSSATKSLIHQYTAQDGIKVGAEKAWLPDGTLITDLVWKDGKADGSMRVDGSGNFYLHSLTPYTTVQLKNGVKEGPQRTFGSSHDGFYVSKVEHFKDGTLDGPTEHFDAAGEVVLHLQYSQGEMVMDEATTRSIAACIQGWEDRYRNSWSGDKGQLDRIEYQRPDWESRCKKGYRG